jgi:hypothetical protein
MTVSNPQMARKPALESTADQPKRVAAIVSAEGTDDDIRARCAEHVDGWDRMGEADRADCVRLTRLFWSRSTPPRFEGTTEGGMPRLDTPEGESVTLHALRMVGTMGANSADYVYDRASDLTNYFAKQDSLGATPQRISAAVAFVSGGNPADTVQSSLLVQMAATHDAAMRALANAGAAPFIEQTQMFGNLATKLLNAYARQAETLNKLQRGGEQVIKHVHIDNRHGGQTVVTDTIVRGGADGQEREQPHAAIAVGASAALLGHDAQGNGVPIPGSERQAAMQDARGDQSGRTGG